jgi:hypothetical protein
MRIIIGLLALAGLLPMAARAQTSAPIDLASFDQADRRARTLLSTIRCAQSAGSARAQGEFGPVDALGGIGQCITIDGRTLGVFFDADSPYVAVKRFSAVDLGTHMRRTAPLDTSRVLAVVRAEQAAYWHGANTPFEKEDRPFAPVAFRFDGDSIEVWLIPASLVMGPPFTVGGERGYLFTPDGRTLVRTTDAFGDYRPIAIPDTGAVNIASRGTTVPSLSELVLANGLTGAGRSVAIQWAGITSVLAGQGGQAVWMHLTRKP